MLARHITDLSGVGPQVAANLAKLGLLTPLDLLFHLPRDYEDRTRTQLVTDCKQGQFVLLDGTISAVKVINARKRMLTAEFTDDSGTMLLRWFRFYPNQVSALKQEGRVRVFGECRQNGWQYEMAHPEYIIYDPAIATPPLEDRLTPIYQLTQGIGQKRLRQIILGVLAQVVDSDLPEYLADVLGNDQQVVFKESLLHALQFVHQPPIGASIDQLRVAVHPAQKRLIVEEFVAHRLGLQWAKQKLQVIPAPALVQKKLELLKKFIAGLPFKLTKAQLRCWHEIQEDIQQSEAMLRLLQGDVGSGKTVVATLALLQAVSAGFQSALMAPTEILAEQHYVTLQRWLEPLGIRVGLLISKQPAAKRRTTLAALAGHELNIIVGTHALFQDQVDFNQLGLVVIDEQHRFGVNQRQSLIERGREKQSLPHQLIMTATPIPRTLAMTAYADLAVSVIDELPPGRTPIQTIAVSDKRRADIINRIHEACQQGKQVYWVCTLIEESESLNAQAAEAAFERLQAELNDCAIGLVHGRLKSDEKQSIMKQFIENKLDILVATTVIEVGVDVPNASLIVIENPERLGLSQLHQLRGRVGRGAKQSFCVLLYQAPLSYNAEARIRIMRETTDGFKIAEEDLRLRGPGELLGTRQAGSVQFKLASLLRDQDLLETARDLSEALWQKYPERIEPLVKRWVNSEPELVRS